MKSTTVPPSDVTTYLSAVRQALADLPPDERDDLLGEVDASVREAAAESDLPIAMRLGPPEEFAAELRAAAGLSQRPTRDDELRPRRGEALRTAWAGTRARFSPLAHDLAPLWWVARAYVVVAGFAFLSRADWSTAIPVVPRFGSAALGTLVLAAAIVASIALGRRARHAPRRFAGVLLVLNAALALAAVPVLVEALERANQQRALLGNVAAYAPQVAADLAYDGRRLTNVYPYTRDGRLLQDVLLYDSAGRPLDVAPGERAGNRRVLRTADGRILYNSFPIRYFEPGTREVERPGAGPSVQTPRILTPPLRQRADRR